MNIFFLMPNPEVQIEQNPSCDLRGYWEEYATTFLEERRGWWGHEPSTTLTHRIEG